MKRYSKFFETKQLVKSQPLLHLYKNSTLLVEPLYGVTKKYMPHLNYEILLNELEKLLKHFPEKSKILIINGNQGFLALTLAKLGHHVTILEPFNLELIQSLRLYWKLEKLIEIIEWNESEIELKLEKNFDLVICAHTSLYLNQNFGTDKANQILNKIYDQSNYVLVIEFGHDSGKWWLPFIENHQIAGRFQKKYTNVIINNRLSPLNMFLISKTNPKKLSIFEYEPMKIIEKNYPNDGRNDAIQIYESSTRIYKKIKNQNKSTQSAELEVSNINDIELRIRKKLELPEFKKYSNEDGEIFISREKYIGNIIYNQKDYFPNSVAMFINLMVLYSRNRCFHNDLRPWNLIVTSNKVNLIDYENFVGQDQDPSGYPQWIAMLALCNYLSQEGTRVWKHDEFLEAASKLIDFRQPIAQLYYEESWYLLHKKRKKLLKLNFLDVDDSVNGFLEIMNPMFTRIQKYWMLENIGFKNL